MRIVYRGEARFLNHNGSIESRINGGSMVELRVEPDANAQELLRTVAANATIITYETVEPSLEEIFIATVGTNHGI